MYMRCSADITCGRLLTFDLFIDLIIDIPLTPALGNVHTNFGFHAFLFSN